MPLGGQISAHRQLRDEQPQEPTPLNLQDCCSLCKPWQALDNLDGMWLHTFDWIKTGYKI